MRVLVTGASGMLGFALADSCPAGIELVGTDVDTLDITDAGAVGDAMARHAPAAVVNAAAYTDVDGCESHEAEALAVNGAAAGILAAACATAGVPLVHVSTDYVFDGRIPAPGEYHEDDPVGPLSAYGRTKLAGEVAVREALDAHWIVRTQWLYGVRGKNFVETMLRLASERDRLAVVDDQVGSPTSTHVLAPYLWRFVTERPAFGTYHCTGGGSCSWHGFAAEIFRQAGRAPDDPVLDTQSSDALDRPAPRPTRSVLSNAKLMAALGDAPGPWTEGLSDYMRRRQAVGAQS